MKRKVVKKRKKKRLKKSEGGKKSRYTIKKQKQNKGIYSPSSPFKATND